ncbi:MAG: D-tyrosyl-tRNA(Tyr) deacylase, partial [Cytophagales bacterium]|nr:D-tyrosyl-tRNA(Tyr) deacylase [Cytophaga sp.]
SVEINGSLYSSIQSGLLILLGITHSDEKADADWLSSKICQMRIFADSDGKMNVSLLDISGDLLVVSQFTLQASTQKGNRPSFIEAARPEQALPLYEYFISKCEEQLNKKVLSGQFGADMKVALINDGPVTIIIDSKNKQ